MAASPSAFSLPSTPSHPSHSTASPSPSTSRHLKRLSLGGSAFSPSSPSSPASPNTLRPNHGTPTSATRGHGNRALRLSMSGGGGVGYTRDSASPSSAPPTGESPTASRSSSDPNEWSFPQDGTSSAPTTPGGISSGTAGVPSGSRSLGRSASGGHSRRMSSISYASSSREAGESPLGGGGALASPSPSAQRSRLNGNLGVASPSSSRSISPIGERGEEEKSRSVTPNAGVREGEVEPSRSPVLGRGAGGGSPNLSRGGGGGQPTLTEANADLLSFIAKKERKCLDLREELKRHESELQSLKKKWEAIVAKSLLSSSPPTTTSMPRLSSPDMKRSSHASASSTSSLSTTSPHTSPTPRPHAPLHTLDLSLLSSTFDPTSAHDGAGTPEIELPESVQAATKWMGGMFGKVLDAVGAVEEAMSPAHERGEEERGLGSLAEEEEPEEEGVEGSPKGAGGSEASKSSREERRASKASSASIDSSSSFGFGFLGGGGESSARTSTSTEHDDQGATPTPSSPAALPTSEPLCSPDLTQRRHALTSPPPPSFLPRSNSSHARSRSTFDVLSGVTSGGWSSLGKRWTAVTESETFKNGRKTTYGLLDTFEQGLATALGPLDPPPLSPIQDDEFGAREPNPSDDRRAEGEVKTPKQGDDWDWSAFLDGDDPTASTTSGQQQPKIGGYRRPSLTPKHTTSSTLAKSPKSPNSATGKVLASAPSPSAQAKRLSGSSERKVPAASAEKAAPAPAPREQQEQEDPKPALPDKADGYVSDSWATW